MKGCKSKRQKLLRSNPRIAEVVRIAAAIIVVVMITATIVAAMTVIVVKITAAAITVMKITAMMEEVAAPAAEETEPGINKNLAEVFPPQDFL